MTRTKQLTFFTAGYRQVSTVFPYMVASPAYFAGHIQLGGLTQTASAFDSVQQSLSFFINVYRQLAEWCAVIDRLAGFEAAIANGQRVAQTPPVVSIAERPGSNAITIEALELDLPTGAPLLVGE